MDAPEYPCDQGCFFLIFVACELCQTILPPQQQTHDHRVLKVQQAERDLMTALEREKQENSSLLNQAQKVEVEMLDLKKRQQELDTQLQQLLENSASKREELMQVLSHSCV